MSTVGPLEDISVIELAGIGPGPHCAMLLADLGADVIRIDRPRRASELPVDVVLQRGKRSIVLDLKQPRGVEIALRLVASADALIEGLRPGVAERIGIGPDVCFERNPRLVYGRMTGWGQTGPLASTAGHDIDYLAISGALHAVGTEEKPVPPLNLVADFGGGSLYLAVGILAGVLHAKQTGEGQVIDAAMVDGAAHLSTMFHGLLAGGAWAPTRRSNLLDGGSPFYDTYETADGHHVAVGALESQFYSELVEKLGLGSSGLPDRWDRPRWSELRARFAMAFREKTRDEWAEVFASSDACVTPVLSFVEAPHHPHISARETFIEIDGVVQPAPAPRFSGSPTGTPSAPASHGQHTEEILTEAGFSVADVDRLRENGVID